MKAARHHLESLDAFRGLAVAGMILVNNPGNWDTVYPPLTHSNWDGCTFADLVFPAFIFIMGVAIPFAFSRRIASGHERDDLLRRIARRTLWLVALGLALNAIAVAPAVATMRIPGVLQRIGVVYLITSIVCIHTGVRGRVAVACAFVLGHWVALTLIPFGGHGPIATATENLPAYVDRVIFGRHMLALTGDPEGALGTFPAVATALAGTCAGQWLSMDSGGPWRAAWLALGCAALAASGLVWSIVLPLNKPMWTGSYALFTAGLAGVAFAACYAVIDLARVRLWARPFVWLGLNPLAVYFLSEAVGHLLDRRWISIGGQATTVKTWLYFVALDRVAGGWLPDPAMSLLFGVLTVIVWTSVAGVLYWRGIRVQV